MEIVEPVLMLYQQNDKLLLQESLIYFLLLDWLQNKHILNQNYN